MDPNETLALIRKLTREIDQLDYRDLSDDASELIDLTEELCTLVNSLDSWFVDGGFLPGAWANQAKPSSRRDLPL
jgi:hypothetical protein